MGRAKTFFGDSVGLGDPSDEPYVITPDDENDLPDGECNFIHIGVAGDLTAVFSGRGETPVTIPGLQVGYHPLRITRIMEATTAQDITAFY